MSASTPKATGGVQLILMTSRYVMITAAVQAHAAAGELPKARSVCGITVEQSPSGKPNAKAKGNVLGVSAQYIGGEGGEGGSGKGCAGVGDSTAVGSGGCCGGEGGDGSNSGKGGDDDAWSRMVTAGGEETAVAEIKPAKPAGSVLLRMELVSSTVRSENFCSRTAVEDELAVLAINWTVPGSVACRLMAVMSTSLGGLR